MALAGAVLIFAGQWSSSVYYVDRVVWVDRTPPEVNLLGAWLTLWTLALGSVSLPRWQAFLAVGACVWVVLIFWQGI